MKKTTYTVTRFDIREGFYVEITPSTDKDGKEMYDFVLCLKNYGIKSLMFGLFANDCPEETWEGMIENNVDEYIESFLDDMEYWDNQPIE